jgi:signal transduction histidine kinase/CheY-like chemotaxis protein
MPVRFLVRSFRRSLEKLRRAGSAFETIMRTTPSLMVAINNDAEVEYISDSLLKAIGISQKEYAVGRPLLDLIPSGEMRMQIQEVMEQSGYVEQNSAIDFNGKKFWLMLRSTSMAENSIARFFEWTNITPIMQAKNEAETAARAKSDFLAGISHEIRTPMNAIIGMTDLMLIDRIEGEQGNRAKTIKGAAQSLLNIINDILDFSKIEAKKLEILPEPFHFASFINDTINIIAIKTREQGLTFTTFISPNIPQGIICDALRLRQCLINILNNAAKFTREGSIHLRAWTELMEDGGIKLYFSIKDTGVGIRKEDMGKLFLEFQQLDSRRNRNLVGTGLGLAISNQLIELMGGKIYVESEYGKGSVFTFFVIAKLSLPARLVTVSFPETRYALCYEPDPWNAEAMDAMLKSLDVPHDVCGTPEEMRRLLDRCTYSHVFFDSSAAAIADAYRGRTETAFIPLRDLSAADTAGFDFSMQRPVLTTGLGAALDNRVTTARYDRAEEKPAGEAFFTVKDAAVLVVDDNPVNILVARSLLAKYGIEADIAEDGAEAIARVTQKQLETGGYDLVFMDHMMPGTDGIDATREIREWEQKNPSGRNGQRTPIIALTANAVSGMEELFLKSGMDGFLSKPIMLKSLREILLRFLPAEKVRQENY